MKSIYSKIIIFLIVLGGNTANAQLTEFQSMYFQNQYLANPAMAGTDKGLNLNIGYQRQWAPVPGDPVLMNATVEYNSGDRVGLGLNVHSDKAGLINRTRVLGTYAYHLPIGGNDQKINFGLSLGASFASIDYNKIVGSIDDPTVQNFKEGGVFDGDFGVAYTSKLLTIQAAVPNLHGLFFDNNDGTKKYVDRPVFYSAVSYKILLSNEINDFNIEPLVAYRGVKGYKDILDLGARFNMPEHNINLSGFYHSNESFSAALGITLDKFGAFLSYSNYIGNNGAYANNTFEFGLNYRFRN
ncbi:PorP/SprF family type IX secretion system membrane protein [Flavobacterium sp. LS1R49]|uniref:PorP/SprF family type IX secretion system membrane protein n=1 Tax=Flavobacterium shii TaxID=2987687 RepID=A0A9X2ZDI1_9FLAO|nr:PorP/SprF family type IX secretion system membrane protein [Flavobacterium shii]MCV9928595.1 PorP/SprF family type IX secretion system membrane protein [Flavobacterium shii]